MPKATSFQIDHDEIWLECSLSKYALCDGVAFSILNDGHDVISRRKVLPPGE